ncbi:hypothetical protein [Streptomyces sp. MP131-18]|uniref:hypothetical protein n=1 Tax=Streptomyces sp. MP131-18 TaxID=1857892 RepID=UPI0011802550|nr:hypothetical protein [Streptomyces sp. MP131-18]
MSNQVLLIGGPKDGEWVTTRERVFEVAHVEEGAHADVFAPVKRVVYQVESIALFGRRLMVALPLQTLSTEREEAVIRAVFQRDVAQEILREGK